MTSSFSALPELSATAEPEFTDPGQCRGWLENLPLANVQAAQKSILEQVAELNRFPVSAAHRLEMLEAMREAVNFVQIEQAKRFSNRAQPLSSNELAVFQATDRLWEEMRLGYLRCLRGALDGEPSVRAQAALISQRSLAYSGLKMFHHHRAYRAVPGSDWRGLNEAYLAAEQLQVAEEPVKDFLNRDVHDTSPRIAYARGVLMGLSNPHELAQRQLTFVAYLLERWASKLEIGIDPVDEGEGAPPMVVDLSGEAAPERRAGARLGPTIRFLDTRKLAKTLRNRVGLLRKGESPAKLALGEDCVQPSCEQMLVFLFRHWCQGKAPRVAERHAHRVAASVMNDLRAVHLQLSGRPFRQPGHQSELSKKQREEIATFGRVSTRHEEAAIAQIADAESWQIEDESSLGLRMVRPAGEGGRRYSHGQLVLVRTADGKSMMLAQVRWLVTGLEGELVAGLKLLPGLPGPCAVRATGLNVKDEQYVPALTLGSVEALKLPPSLILEPGWFKPKRVIELFLEGSVRVRFTELLERGMDFERAAYEVLPD